DYDIDDGVYFDKGVLVGDRGAEMSALQARQMVRDALDDGSFKTPPEVRTNCVRVYYEAGFAWTCQSIAVLRPRTSGAMKSPSSRNSRAAIGSAPMPAT